MRVYRENLPNSCLLILTESDDNHLTVLLLTEALQQACGSGKSSIWVDCSQVQQLSSTVLAVLRHYASWLQQQHITLVVCHPPDSLQMERSDANLLVAPSLLDAELQCRSSGPRLAGIGLT
ncbi:STAS domain-containing protein [Hymenobacter fodinae]|uniref:STAS domain-containing protein n=1 Tax=Hymenobacter fodinae TaxID=2510796 RepID=A0A4Z0P5U3_9BACT|nr:STAS domain-containing protein [Hymenobacter fodinae]TGE06556.1 STAS domain-containing protein [Hymenobacter fodinae]